MVPMITGVRLVSKQPLGIGLITQSIFPKLTLIGGISIVLLENLKEIELDIKNGLSRQMALSRPVGLGGRILVEV